MLLSGKRERGSPTDIPCVVDPTVTSKRQEHVEVQPDGKVIISLAITHPVHHIWLVQLRLQLIPEVPRHCRQKVKGKRVSVSAKEGGWLRQIPYGPDSPDLPRAGGSTLWTCPKGASGLGGQVPPCLKSGVGTQDTSLCMGPHSYGSH